MRSLTSVNFRARLTALGAGVAGIRKFDLRISGSALSHVIRNQN